MSGLLDLLAAGRSHPVVHDSDLGTSSWRWEVPDGWQQGRGCWGGLLIGSLVRAAGRAAAADDHAVRHLSAQVVAAVPPGPADVVAEVLRRGSGTVTVSARVRGRAAGPDGLPHGDPGVLAHATVVLGRARAADAGADGPAWCEVPVPEAVAWGWAAAPVVPLGPPVAPVFLGQMQTRPLRGFPGQGAADPTTEGWIALRPGDVSDPLDLQAYVAAMVDAWWPVAMVRLAAPRPVATVGFALDLPAPALMADVQGVDGEGVPMMHRGRLVAARDGFVTETRELWSQRGRLLGWNTQTMAIIR